jgi:hypothetical protein
MDRRIGFIEEKTRRPTLQHTLGTGAMECNPTLPPGSTHTLRDYSRHLHLSTTARASLNNPAALQSSTSSVIRASAAPLEGDAPSKTTSFRWRQHTSVIPVQRSRSFPEPPRLPCNHGTKHVSACGIHPSFPHQRRQADQTSRAKTHPTSR